MLCPTAEITYYHVSELKLLKYHIFSQETVLGLVSSDAFSQLTKYKWLTREEIMQLHYSILFKMEMSVSCHRCGSLLSFELYYLEQSVMGYLRFRPVYMRS